MLSNQSSLKSPSTQIYTSGDRIPLRKALRSFSFASFLRKLEAKVSMLYVVLLACIKSRKTCQGTKQHPNTQKPLGYFKHSLGKRSYNHLMLELLRLAHKSHTAETHLYLFKNVNRHAQS